MKQERSKKKDTAVVKHKTLSKKPKADSDTKQRKWIARSIEWMKEGWSVRQIKDAIYAQKEGGLARSTIEKIVFEANRLIIQDYSQDRANVTSLHVKRYNRQIKRLLETRDDDVIDPDTGEADIAKGRIKKINAYFHCLDTMFQKEKLLQFHNKSFKIVINNIEEIEIQDAPKKKKLDLTKLSFAERLELYQLMMKAKKTDNELQGVIVGEKKEEVTIDIEHEVIQETNLDKVKEKKVDKIEKPGLTLPDVAAKLRKAALKQSIKEIEKAGGKVKPNELQ